MLATILIVVAALIVGVLLLAASRSSDVHVARTATLTAPPSAVFPHLNDLRKFQAWSPWAKLDPNCQVTFEGPATGIGSSFSWTGNNKVGAGKMTITDSRASETVGFHMDFYKPFAGVAEGRLVFKPSGSGTEATWTMDSKANFMMKVMGLFMSMDKAIGAQFEKGLANLDAVSRAGAATDKV
ncbi:MAG TPA: SRPBCC family protein [Opitutaceae bacterium]|nr:SRPBCC family protein [Opitutaceae bacterium]